MKDYAKTKRIPLSSATKEELIEAIKRMVMFDPIEKAEKSIYWIRQKTLLQEMNRINGIIQNLPPSKTAFHRSYRFRLHTQFDRVNKKLSELQGD